MEGSVTNSLSFWESDGGAGLDFSCDFVDRPPLGKDSIHEITLSRTKKTVESIERHYTSVELAQERALPGALLPEKGEPN